MDKDTFIELATISSCNVLMLTHKGYYKQIDGLAMGSPPAPHLANGWLSQYDQIIKGNSQLFTRYMDDVLQEMKRNEIADKLTQINNLHPNLTFTIERETNGTIPFLDMQIRNTGGILSSTWYSKPTDTGLILNFHALAPRRYKKSVVSGFVHRIVRACSNWLNVHNSLEKAKKVLEQNQYPPVFYNPIIEQTLRTIYERMHCTKAPESTSPTSPGEGGEMTPAENKVRKKLLFVQYRGKCSERLA